ncbi:hypothetical protein [Pseudomonas sp. 5P_3.1_Bac2]
MVGEIISVACTASFGDGGFFDYGKTTAKDLSAG